MFLAAEFLKNTILILSIIQCTFAACIVIMGDTIHDQFEDGLFANGKNLFTKIWNFIAYALFGLGPFIYKKKAKHRNWLVKRMVMGLWVLMLILMAGIINILISSFV
ncbi:hypothetical protein CEF21_21290 [Bacillus sp. FJAT-42376]|uniref:hypothetical protein n=1 Tax=Bacillus sp. FJAT-42376 TaxID=2014076 RepID=UPI000F507CE2|nr:hypothetical protein [Bacillus sp. FJAT-42376]AZB44617.1 hypothetical protein CEF21_21290 [Bacillus sp. FJAT-42376]